MPSIELTEADESRVAESTGSLFGACLAAMEPAGRAGIAERYARERLEQQAVAGVVDVDDPASDT